MEKPFQTQNTPNQEQRKDIIYYTSHPNYDTTVDDKGNIGISSVIETISTKLIDGEILAATSVVDDYVTTSFEPKHICDENCKKREDFGANREQRRGNRTSFLHHRVKSTRKTKKQERQNRKRK